MNPLNEQEVAIHGLVPDGDSSKSESSPRSFSRSSSMIHAPQLREPVGYDAQDEYGHLYQRVTKGNWGALIKTQKEHLKETGSFYLETSNYYSDDFDFLGAPSREQEALRDIYFSLGLSYDPKERGENCAMFRRCYSQPKFKTYIKHANPDKTLEMLMESSSEKLATEIINGKYDYCSSPVHQEAHGLIGASRRNEPETILSPLANVSPKVHASFMTIKRMLGFGPYLEFHSFPVVPDDKFEVATSMWVTLAYWD